MAKTIEIYEKMDMTSHVREVGKYLSEELGKLSKSCERILEIRGCGLIQGIRLDGPVGDVINKALEKGLVLISARSDVIRLVPPLVIEKEHVDEMIRILKKLLEE